MRRVFTRDIGGGKGRRPRYARGDVRDYPLTTWRAFFGDFEKVTELVDDAVARGLNRGQKRVG